ncbi:MAG TPA: hypothetical protein VFX25_35185 [Streptosporangiaceae bacterium]|nr:hypothetical protein [Streptosporangiaceae bacterium]
MKSASPAGSGQGRQVRLFHRSATGAPPPPGLVPPNAHASARLSARTAENPEASAGAP